MNNPQILLVDDDLALLQALPPMLARHIPGLHVDPASSAIDALKLIHQYEYDAILSDIMMPGLNGLELLAHIRKLRPNTPTLLITGHFDPFLLQQAMNAGAYDFIQKPVERFSLIASLKRAIQTRQLQRQVQRQQQLLESYARMIGPLAENGEQRQLIHQTDTPFQPPKWLL